MAMAESLEDEAKLFKISDPKRLELEEKQFQLRHEVAREKYKSEKKKKTILDEELKSCENKLSNANQQLLSSENVTFSKKKVDNFFLEWIKGNH